MQTKAIRAATPRADLLQDIFTPVRRPPTKLFSSPLTPHLPRAREFVHSSEDPIAGHEQYRDRNERNGNGPEEGVAMILGAMELWQC